MAHNNGDFFDFLQHNEISEEETVFSELSCCEEKQKKPVKKNLKPWSCEENAKLLHLVTSSSSLPTPGMEPSSIINLVDAPNECNHNPSFCSDKQNITKRKRKCWRDIASNFPDRSMTQVLNQWKKVVNPRVGTGSWTPKEDKKLLSLVKKYGVKRWALISEFLPRRSGKRCRERYVNHLNPKLKNTPWTDQEEEALIQAQNNSHLGNRWAEIANDILPGRSVSSIRNHWATISRRGTMASKGKLVENVDISCERNELRNINYKTDGGKNKRWTEEDGNLLRSLVKKHGAKKWFFLASHFEGKTDIQCMQHWNNVLNPKVIKGKGSWTSQEDQILIDKVAEFGCKWSKIAKCLPGRIGKQCRERYVNKLDPLLKKGEWSKEEEYILEQEHLKSGNKWAVIAKMLPGRSCNDVKNHWYSFMHKKQKPDERVGSNSMSIESGATTSLEPVTV